MPLNREIVPRLRRALLWVSVAGLTAIASAGNAAESVNQASISLGYGVNSKMDAAAGYGTDDKKVKIGQFEYLNIWKYGDNYFDIEGYNGKRIGNIPALSAVGANSGSFGDNTDYRYLAVYNGRISASKVLGTDLSFGFVKDIYPAVRLEATDYANFHSVNGGLSFDLAVPGFTFFETAAYLRDDQFTGDTSRRPNLLWRTVAMAPFQIGGLQMMSNTLLLVNFRHDDRGTQIYLRPDLWVKLGDTPIDLGIRAEWHSYDLNATEGGGRYSRLTPFLLARWNL